MIAVTARSDAEPRTFTLVGMGAVVLPEPREPAPLPVMPLPRRKTVALAPVDAEVNITFEFPSRVGLLLVMCRHDGVDWSSLRAFHRRDLTRVYLHRLPSEEQSEVVRFADERLERAS